MIKTINHLQSRYCPILTYTWEAPETSSFDWAGRWGLSCSCLGLFSVILRAAGSPSFIGLVVVVSWLGFFIGCSTCLAVGVVFAGNLLFRLICLTCCAGRNCFDWGNRCDLGHFFRLWSCCDWGNCFGLWSYFGLQNRFD